MPMVRPCLWFDAQAEEAASFYVSLFPRSRIVETRRFGKGAPFPEGSAMSVTFDIDGQEVLALNGGPMFRHTPAFSMFVTCEGQEDVDRLWAALVEGGKPGRCAWLEDRWGVSWQIVPKALGRLLADPDPGRAERAMKAMLGMSKIDVAELERAAAGG